MSDYIEPGTITFSPEESQGTLTIFAVAPVNRDTLRNRIADIRRNLGNGVELPIEVIHYDPETGEHRSEHIPGCASCSI